METFSCIGMDLPVVKRLAEGVVLCAHPNGPAVCGQREIVALSCFADRPESQGYETDDFGEDDERASILNMDDIGRQAIDAYVKLSWPLVREKFFPNESWKTFFAKQT